MDSWDGVWGGRKEEGSSTKVGRTGLPKTEMLGRQVMIMTPNVAKISETFHATVILLIRTL